MTVTANEVAPVKKPKHNTTRPSLKIYQPKRCIVVEEIKTEDGEEYITKGSNLNCGACGGHLGSLTSDLLFPFTVNDLKSRIKDSQIIINSGGLRCKRKICRALLFPELTDIVFTSFENFKKVQTDDKEKQQKVFDAWAKTAKKKNRVAKRKAMLLKVYMFFRKITTWITKPIINLFARLKTTG